MVLTQIWEETFPYFSYCDCFADKQFVRLNWQTSIFDQTNNLIWTPCRANQKCLNSPGLKCWLSKIRERIEGVYYEIQDTGRNMEFNLSSRKRAT